MRSIFASIVSAIGGGSSLKIRRTVCGQELNFRTFGLDRSLGVEIEIVECPKKYADPIERLLQLISFAVEQKPDLISRSNAVNCRFESPTQSICEVFRFEHSDSHVVRVLDAFSASRGFPKALLASHLCANAEGIKRREDKLRLLLVSIEAYPGEETPSDAPVSNGYLNPNNFCGWFDCGAVLADLGESAGAIEHWKTAACRWPIGALVAAEKMRKRAIERAAIDPTASKVAEFWSRLDEATINSWIADRAR